MTDPRLQLYQRGYTDLVSVAPPGAPISAGSGLNPDDLGKRPAVRGSNGVWHGYSWTTHQPSEEEVRRWVEWGSNVGLRGNRFPALDIDSLDAELTGFVRQLAFELLGAAPVRSRGGAPKELLVYRSSEPISRTAIRIGQHLVEMLGAGRQYLVYGTHPNQTDYYWLKTPLWEVDPERLTEVSAERVEYFFEQLESIGYIQEQGEVVRIGSAAPSDAPPQQLLQAPSLRALQDAVAAVDNDERFDDRQEYITMGHAIKAAAGDDEDAAFDIFLDWALRWENGTNDPETVRSDWRRMRPPYRVGYSWIAEKSSGHVPARYYFKANPDAGPQLMLDDEGVPVELTHDWLAKRVLPRVAGQLKYDVPNGHWHLWDGTRWAQDHIDYHREVVKAALRVLAKRLEAAAAVLGEGQKKKYHATISKLGDQATLNAVINMLETEPEIAVGVDAFDTEEWELNTPDGIVDLETGTLHPHDPAKLHSKVTAVAPGGSCPRWHQFLDEVTDGNEELQRFLQKTCGYALTGVRREQTLNFVWGPGGNGKSVFLDAIMGIMDDYAATAPMDTFALTKGDKHPTDLAGLMGARLVTAAETQAGRSWDEQRIKAITGGDRMRARFMRQDFVEFTPRFKLILVGNHEPQIDNVDDAMKRRIHIVPFTFKPEEPDLLLPEKLREEWPGILSWMIDGCLAWQHEGLEPPEVVVARTEQYFEEEDMLGLWFEECCETVPTGHRTTTDEDAIMRSTDAYESWARFCRDRGEEPGSHRQFSRAMRSLEPEHGLTRGLVGEKESRSRGWFGATLKQKPRGMRGEIV